MTNTIYSKYNINPNKLSRDYIKNPLNKTKSSASEKPTKEDLLYLYIELNLTYDELKIIFGWSKSPVIRWNRKYKISKGGHNHTRAKETCLKKYGNETPFLNKKFKEKSVKTKLERYGEPYYSNPDKRLKTCFENYGRTNVGYFGSDENTKAILGKYGVDNYTKTDEYKKLYENKHWVNEMNQKRCDTMKKNNSFIKSKPEDNYYKHLCEDYGIDDIIRQYKSDLYPFNCDFYIKSIDTYIEYQGTWVHGEEPYDPNNKEHQLIVEKWKQKDLESDRTKAGKKSFYSCAIKYWTIRDPLKRKTAHKNGLNFIEIW